jgi:hypothetical protein
MLSYIILCYIIFYHVMLYYIMLYYIILYCIILYFIIYIVFQICMTIRHMGCTGQPNVYLPEDCQYVWPKYISAFYNKYKDIVQIFRSEIYVY